MVAEKLCLLLALGLYGFVSVAAQGNRGFLMYDPCWDKACHTYARCEVNSERQAVCLCPKNCSSVRKPVCGTNWKTYDNMCALMQESCVNNDWTRLRYYGSCNAGECRNTRWQYLQCPFHSECTLKRGLPGCTCSRLKCSRDYKPVCATNDKTYRNPCALKLASCQTKTWLRTRSYGHCSPDPCRSYTCCCGAVCRVNETNGPSCECDLTCPRIFDPVCGSDGNTYASACNLRHEACIKQNSRLVQVRTGPCRPTTQRPAATQSPAINQSPMVTRLPTTTPSTNVTQQPTSSPCEFERCPPYAKCVVLSGVAKCVCPKLCPGFGQLVCGSDGNTYENECALKTTSCKSRMLITVVEIQKCGYPPATTAPTTVPPQPPTTQPSTTQPPATQSLITLLAAANPCQKAICAYYAKCEVEQGAAMCVCPALCPSNRDPVCGSDDVTYKNECNLRRTSCKSQKNISVVVRGPCAEPTTRATTVTPQPPSTQPPTSNPCDFGRCAYYANCEIIEGAAMCVCPTLCPNITRPVCGSDGNTYENVCNLRRKSCRSHRTISIIDRGRCAPSTTPAATVPPQPPVTQPPTVSPCDFVRCAYYSICEMIRDVPMCVCPALCPTNRIPVCGSDGTIYRNECDLRRTSCKSQRRISVVERSLCDPPPTPATTATTLSPSAILCNMIRCAHYSRCEVVQGAATCVCPAFCPTIVEPVCGSDGLTYENECVLRRRSCKSQRTVSILERKPCVSSPTPNQATNPPPELNPCHMVRCAHYSKCAVVHGRAVCLCPAPCPNLGVPVCGSDGVTYENECDLRIRSCKSQTSISVAVRGPCAQPTLPPVINQLVTPTQSLIGNPPTSVTQSPGVNPCLLVRCAHYSRCEVVQGGPVCLCPSRCPNLSVPVCGSDGVTYLNECDLRVRSCKSQAKITVAARAPCATAAPTTVTKPTPITSSPAANVCKTASCAYFSTCQVINGVPKCICPNICPRVIELVCGSDGKTYENKCLMRSASCELRMNITVVGKGACGPTTAPPSTTVPPGTHSPCAFGKCGYYATCKVIGGIPQCLCPQICPTISAPVCGSDGKTYENECDMKRASCRNKQRITVAKNGFCEPFGSCPIPKICQSNCNNDVCARTRQICCCQGCRYECTTPIWQGGQVTCPVDPLACHTNNDCSAGMICCPDGCTKRCIAPTL